MTEIRATFLTLSDAQSAVDKLAKSFPSATRMLEVAPPRPVLDTAREGRTMARIVGIIVLASVLGTVIGVLLGVVLHVLVGPKGTSGLIIQVVSWAIFAHLIIGMLAGYFLLADRTEREIGRTRPVMLVIQCANIDADAVRTSLRGLGAIDVEEHTPTNR